jgi:hypothetical protein
MEAARIMMERSEARELYEKYQGAVHYGTGMDKEIARAYRLLSQGKLIIKALESVKAAGLGDDGLPMLAISRADATKCFLTLRDDGRAEFAMNPRDRNLSPRTIRFAEKTFSPNPEHFPRLSWSTTGRSNTRHGEAIVPIVPVHLRPKAALNNYHILWEADWREVPRDPFLLRRLGKGDLWLVLAMWDLTEIERAALQARV